MKLKLLICSLAFATIANAQGTWTSKANFGGTTRNYAVSFSIGTKGYIGTGYKTIFYQDLWEWNQVTNVWTQKANFGGTAREGAVGFSIGTKGYIGTGRGGGGYKQDFWEWDQASNVWTQKVNFGGTARMGATGFSIGTKGYIGMGYDDIVGYTQDFWEWNQTTNIWTQKVNFGGGVRGYAVGFSIGTKGYVGTGTDNSSLYKDFWEWDQTTNVWSQKANFGGVSRDNAVSFSIGNKGYIGIGSYGAVVCNDVWEWDQATNIWIQKANIPIYLQGNNLQVAIGFSIGAKGYIETFQGSQNFWEWCDATAIITASGPFSFCQGGSITLTAGTSNSYLWSNGATSQTIVIASSGTFVVTTTNTNGCSVTSSLNTITVNPSPTVTLSFNPNTVCVNTGGYALTGGTPSGGTYSGIGIISGNFYPSLAGVGTHSIIYSYTNNYNCSDSATATITVSPCSIGIQDISLMNESVKISPNPSDGIFILSTKEKEYSIIITTLLGEKIYSSQINSVKSKIDLSKQPSGVYFIQVRTDNGTATQKLIIQK